MFRNENRRNKNYRAIDRLDNEMKNIYLERIRNI